MSHDKIIEIVRGLPGVGFRLTDDGDYDIQNKKLRNVASPQTNNDATTKSYVDVEVSKTLKKDGTDQMNGSLNMENFRIENVGPGRHNTADALTHVQFEAFYFDLNTDSGNIEAQNPINMKNERILGVKDPILHSDASNKFYIDNSLTFKADKTQLSNKADKTELANYLKKDGSVSVAGNFDFGDNKITNVGNGSQSTDVVNKGYIDNELAGKPNTNQVILRNGLQDMTGNLNMSQKKIINCGPPSSDYDVTRKSYVDNQFSRCLRLDGSNKMTSNLDMNNLQIKNVKDATHNQDAIILKQVNDAISTTSINNNKYTDQKISESRISTHENRKNVLRYAMDDGEFTEDFGIQDVNLITYDDSPHKSNKKAFSLKVQKTNDGSNLFKGRFDFNLFRMIRDDFSNHYTVCIEVYFEKDGRHNSEFNSFNMSFEKLNMNIDKSHTIKINTDYKYYRSILNISPDGTSQSIQRRLYVNVQSTYDNLSPQLLPLYVLIYGIKGEAKNDLDFTIYDYEKAYEVANNEFQLHVPINMNNNKIIGLLPSYIWGDTSSSISKCDFLIESWIDIHVLIQKIFIISIFVVNSENKKFNTPHYLNINNNVYTLDFSTNISNTVNINRYFQNNTKMNITFSDSINKYLIWFIKYKTFNN